MSFGFGVGDFITIAQVSKLAWDTFTAIRNAPKEWRALESEVQSLAISLRSLDDADTTLSIVQYTKHNPQREQNLKELLSNSNNALAPMKELIERYRVKNSDEKRDIRDWLAGTKFTFKTMSVQEFRNKLSLHTASLNIFLTTLTNTSLGRLEQLIISGQAAAARPGVSLAVQGNSSNNTQDDGFDGVWAAIGRDLALGSGDKKSITGDIIQCRSEIRDYVQFITSGGLPYSKHELSDRRRIRPQKGTISIPEVISVPTQKMGEAVTYSMEIPIEEMIPDGADQEMKSLVDAMVSFDGERYDVDQGQEEEASFENPASPSRSVSPNLQPYISVEEPIVIRPRKNTSRGTTLSTPTSQTRPVSEVRCDCCDRELLVGEMYLHCKICQSWRKEEGYDVCDPCWGKGKSCPGKHRDERYFNHRERRIAEESA
jgi:hypothetical protein